MAGGWNRQAECGQMESGREIEERIPVAARGKAAQCNWSWACWTSHAIYPCRGGMCGAMGGNVTAAATSTQGHRAVAWGKGPRVTLIDALVCFCRSGAKIRRKGRSCPG